MSFKLLFFLVSFAALAASLASAQQQQLDNLAAGVATLRAAKAAKAAAALSAVNSTFPGALERAAAAEDAKESAVNSTLSALDAAVDSALDSAFPGARARIAAARAAKRSKANSTLYSAVGALNASFPAQTTAKIAALAALYEQGLQCKRNPPMLFVPGLFGSFLSISVTAAACAAVPECAALGQTQPAFVARLVDQALPPLTLNDFFEPATPTSALSERVAALPGLLTQTFDPTTDRLSYAPGVAVRSNGTAAGAFCDGVSKSYVDGVIDGYLVKQVGYDVGATLACLPYNWELDMPGLRQDGSFAKFERLVRELYHSPANDPTMPFMPRQKVVVMGHSMGTLFSTSALQVASPDVQAMVSQVVLLSPVSAGADLTWQLTLDGGLEPAANSLGLVKLLLGKARKELFGDGGGGGTGGTGGGISAADRAAFFEQVRLFFWELAQTGAVNPTLAPYDLPPYAFRRLRPPRFPDGFPATQALAKAFDAAGPPPTPSSTPTVGVTVASQLQAVQASSPLFRAANGSSDLAFLGSVWSRAHSYDQTVAFWSSSPGGRGPAQNITIQCAYGVDVDTVLTPAATVPFPFPSPRTAGFQQITPKPDLRVDGKGDGIVNLQGSNGCDRMADNTGGFVFPCESSECEHVKIIENGPDARALLNKVLTAAGIDVNKNRKKERKKRPLCGTVNTTQQIG